LPAKTALTKDVMLEGVEDTMDPPQHLDPFEFNTQQHDHVLNTASSQTLTAMRKIRTTAKDKHEAQQQLHETGKHSQKSAQYSIYHAK